jgi:membrane protein insertase Oxa1/YidC/SpoIIIJ
MTPKEGTFSSLIWLIPVSYFLVNLVSIYCNKKMRGAPPIPDEVGCMKYVIYALPLIMVWFSLGAPAAVGIYWIIYAFADLIQNVILNKFFSLKILEARNEASRVEAMIREEKNIKPIKR